MNVEVKRSVWKDAEKLTQYIKYLIANENEKNKN